MLIIAQVLKEKWLKITGFAHSQTTNKLVNKAANDSARVSGQDCKKPRALGTNQISGFGGFRPLASLEKNNLWYQTPSRLIISNNIQVIFGIVVNDVLIIKKCSLKCKCLIWDQNRVSFQIKTHKIFIWVFRWWVSRFMHVTQICLTYWLLP